jgi:hypothetical protein
MVKGANCVAQVGHWTLGRCDAVSAGRFVEVGMTEGVVAAGGLEKDGMIEDTVDTERLVGGIEAVERQ